MRPKSVLAYRRQQPFDRTKANQPQTQRVGTSGHKNRGPGGLPPGPLSPHFSGEMGTPAGQAGATGRCAPRWLRSRPPQGYAAPGCPPVGYLLHHPPPPTRWGIPAVALPGSKEGVSSMPIATAGLTGFLPGWGTSPPDPGPGGGKSPLALSGLAAVHRAYVAAGLLPPPAAPWCWSAPTTGGPPAWPGTWPPSPGRRSPSSPARDLQFHPGAASRQWEHQRLEVLAKLHQGACPVLAATVEGLLQRTMPPAVFSAHCRQLSAGQACQLEEVADFLVRRATPGVTRWRAPASSPCGGHPGRVLPGLDLPVRVEFWGDEIDSLGLFDPRDPAAHRPAGGRHPPARRGGAGPGGQALPDPRIWPWPRCTTP